MHALNSASKAQQWAEFIRLFGVTEWINDELMFIAHERFMACLDRAEAWNTMHWTGSMVGYCGIQEWIIDELDWRRFKAEQGHIHLSGQGWGEVA